MRGFIILCFSAIAIAAPQGYNYSPTSAGDGGALGGGFVSHGQSGGGVFTGGFDQSAGGDGGYAGAYGGQSAIVTKRFFIHSAPEEEEEAYQEKHITIGAPRKNYNVVFIKAPKGGQSRATIKIHPTNNEEKTVIYVLNQKGDNTEINTQVLDQPAAIHKPEVYFIKYKTPEEAHHAQKKIQAQYDALGGSTQITDEGVGQVSSVIGSLGGGGAGDAVGAGYGGGVSDGAIGGGAVSNGYLPPNFH